jgi:hypothetical protein
VIITEKGKKFKAVTFDGKQATFKLSTVYNSQGRGIANLWITLLDWGKGKSNEQ